MRVTGEGHNVSIIMYHYMHVLISISVLAFESSRFCIYLSHMHTYMCILVHIHKLHIYIYSNIYIYMYRYAHVYINTCTCIYTHTCTYTQITKNRCVPETYYQITNNIQGCKGVRYLFTYRHTHTHQLLYQFNSNNTHNTHSTSMQLHYT